MKNGFIDLKYDVMNGGVCKESILVKEYEVWLEGYAATCEHQTADFKGVYSGIDFKDACKNFLIKNDWDMSYYNEKSNTHWACGFYDNEIDARKHFG